MMAAVARPEQVNFKINPIERARLDRLRTFYGGRSDGEVLRHMIWLADKSLANGDESRLLAEGEGVIAAALSTPQTPTEHACRRLGCTPEELTEIGKEIHILGGSFTRAEFEDLLSSPGLTQPSDALRRIRAKGGPPSATRSDVSDS